MTTYSPIPSKASSSDYPARFREIISDPINLLIPRHPYSGYVVDDHVFLHNGLRVPIKGPNSYYDRFSEILILNRGVHEPLEEYVFSCLIRILPLAPTMIELGAYWGHYSMWLKQHRSKAKAILVEPDAARLGTGQYNFSTNRLTADFIQASIGINQTSVSDLMNDHSLDHIDILHSDIQGAEEEMLLESYEILERRSVDYCFVSTHSQELHTKCISILDAAGYRVEVSSDYDFETTSFDGLIFASSPLVRSLFDRDFVPMKRSVIAAGPSLRTILMYLEQASLYLPGD